MGMNVHVIDVGIGNIRSLTSVLSYLGIGHVVTDNPSTLHEATHVILPGVGSFDAAMRSMERLSFIEPLREYALVDGRPLIGVCLGMQLLCDGSEEGERLGLGLVAGRSRRLIANRDLHRKVPHVGFASVYGHKDEGLFKDIAIPSEFYFTHSYGLEGVNTADLNCAWCDHSQPFIAGFQKANICGVQFHPEKSQSTGLKLLSNFFEWS
jgi:glutamine amidotransferase